MLTNDVAQKGYEDFKALHALANALPDGPEKTALVDKLVEAHESAHEAFRAAGGKYYTSEDKVKPGVSLYIIVGQDFAARDGEPENPESGGTPKQHDDEEQN